MKWWGWGAPDHEVEIPEHALKGLSELLDTDLSPRSPCRYDELRLRKTALSGRAQQTLAKELGADYVRVDRDARILHAAGKGYPDLIKMRGGEIDPAPDAVVYPETAEQVERVLDVCRNEKLAVVPFGGGTSVVGGVEPLRGKFAAVLSIDLRRMAQLFSLDDRSRTATFGPGMRGPVVEEALNRVGFTLGHFPQSYEYSTVGGWVATRSAGQASSGYGRIDELVVALKCVCPAGEAAARAFPGTAAGPSLKELLVGSEGAFGVITEATLKVRPKPERRRYEAWMFKGFSEGAEAFRLLEQEGPSADIARLSDTAETGLSLVLADEDSVKLRIGERYMQARGYSGGCLAILGFEGSGHGVQSRRRAAAAMMRRCDGLYLGKGAGRSWERARFEGPYLRDSLLSRGVMVETLETATEWSDLTALYRGVKQALTTTLEGQGGGAIVMCHISHLYPDGASLYFTFLSPQAEGQEIEQWQAAKRAASDAIVANGGTITHHHAVGRDHLPWMGAEVGRLGIELLRSAKERLDPEGIMNPGKLIEFD